MSAFIPDNSPDFLQILNGIQLKKTNTTDSGEVSPLNNNQKAVDELEVVLNADNGVDIMALRKLILRKGLPNIFTDRNISTRVEVWKILLGVAITFDPPEYVNKAESCPSTFVDKIKDDAFRTFKGNELFWARVQEATLVRVLSALATEHGYVQGMNVLLGPFAYIMPELDAYYSMKSLISVHMPAYVLKNLDGAHRGVALVDKCLHLLDPTLYTFIIGKIPDLTIFSLKYILTLFANTQPLDEVLRLWDAFFAFGIHLNVIVMCVHLMTMRDKIMKLSSGGKIMKLIEESHLDCSVLIEGSLTLVPLLPTPLFEELMTHAFV